jgi:hypothetical protein
MLLSNRHFLQATVALCRPGPARPVGHTARCGLCGYGRAKTDAPPIRRSRRRAAPPRARARMHVLADYDPLQQSRGLGSARHDVAATSRMFMAGHGQVLASTFSSCSASASDTLYKDGLDDAIGSVQPVAVSLACTASGVDPVGVRESSTHALARSHALVQRCAEAHETCYPSHRAHVTRKRALLSAHDYPTLCCACPRYVRTRACTVNARPRRGHFVPWCAGQCVP